MAKKEIKKPKKVQEKVVLKNKTNPQNEEMAVNSEPIEAPTETSAEEITPEPEKEAETPKKKTLNNQRRGTKYLEAAALVDRDKTYPLEEGLDLAKQTCYAKFDAAIDVHLRLSPPKKNEDVVRGSVNLPHGSAKPQRVIIIDEEMIEKISKGWTDFDVAVATPDMMPKLGKLAKILGPRGLMPNPKAGTVTAEPQKIAQELQAGRVEYKVDSLNNVHQSIGRVSWDTAKLAENCRAFISVLPKNRIRSITVVASMGPAVRVNG